MKTVNDTEKNSHDATDEVKDLILIGDSEVQGVFEEEGGIERILTKIRETISPLVFDINEKKDRDQIKSIAYSISRSKTTLDNHGKDIVSVIKEKAKIIDSQRKIWRDECELIRDEFRKPLTEWEETEKQKEQKIIDMIEDIELMSSTSFELIPSDIEAIIAKVKGIDVSSEIFGDKTPEAKLVKYETIESLESTLEKSIEFHKKKAEEMEALKAKHIADAERAAAERERKLVADANERERKLIAENEAALKAQADLIERKARQEADAEKARSEDREHRKRINNEIVYSICATGMLDEDQSKELLRLIHTGEISNLKIVY